MLVSPFNFIHSGAMSMAPGKAQNIMLPLIRLKLITLCCLGWISDEDEACALASVSDLT